MRILKILILWAATAGLCVTLYSYGQVRYYAYENSKGEGYTVSFWQGNSLDGAPGYEKGFKYSHEIFKFERNAERRTLEIILILAVAGMSTLWLWKSEKSTK